MVALLSLLTLGADLGAWQLPIITPGKTPPRFTGTIQVQADNQQVWETDGEQMLLLRGRCKVTKGETTLESEQMVIWYRPAKESGEKTGTVEVYLE